MKIIIQRVNSAAVSVGKDEVSRIGAGLFVLVSITHDDTKKDAEYLAAKLLKIRIMRDDQDKMNLNLSDSKGELLIVSQFTLHADTKGGNRPSFIQAAKPEHAKKIYDHFVSVLSQSDIPVRTGSFGNYMKIETELDGPVTILMDSQE